MGATPGAGPTPAQGPGLPVPGAQRRSSQPLGRTAPTSGCRHPTQIASRQPSCEWSRPPDTARVPDTQRTNPAALDSAYFDQWYADMEVSSDEGRPPSAPSGHPCRARLCRQDCTGRRSARSSLLSSCLRAGPRRRRVRPWRLRDRAGAAYERHPRRSRLLRRFGARPRPRLTPSRCRTRGTGKGSCRYWSHRGGRVFPHRHQ